MGAYLSRLQEKHPSFGGHIKLRVRGAVESEPECDGAVTLKEGKDVRLSIQGLDGECRECHLSAKGLHPKHLRELIASTFEAGRFVYDPPPAAADPTEPSLPKGLEGEDLVRYRNKIARLLREQGRIMDDLAQTSEDIARLEIVLARTRRREETLLGRADELLIETERLEREIAQTSQPLP